MNVGKAEVFKHIMMTGKGKVSIFVNIVNFTQQSVKFDIYVNKMFKLVFDFCVLSQKCIKV